MCLCCAGIDHLPCWHALQVLTTQRSGLVFLLWGRNAQAHAKGGSLARHHVLTAAHPSGLSANRVRPSNKAGGFYGGLGDAA